MSEVHYGIQKAQHRIRMSKKVEMPLPFERDLVEFEKEIEKVTDETEEKRLREELDRRREEMLGGLTSWQRVQLARHPSRPRMLDYTTLILDDLIELHGDRAVGDDPAMITGIGRFHGQTVAIVGQQKGANTEEQVRRNFGMAHPEGYRKALRMLHFAERFGMPVISFVDTPAAHPGIEAEERGQGPAIALNLLECLKLRTPIFAVVLSEGGSGGALGIAVADWVAMFEHAVYMICPPERCAEILWRDKEKKAVAADALKITARDLHELGIIDAVLSEPHGGAHRHPDEAASVLEEEIDRFLLSCKEGRFTPERRQEKFRNMGVWEDQAVVAGD